MILSLTTRSIAENRRTVSYDNVEYLIGEAHGKDMDSLIRCWYREKFHIEDNKIDTDPLKFLSTVIKYNNDKPEDCKLEVYNGFERLNVVEDAQRLHDLMNKRW